MEQDRAQSGKKEIARIMSFLIAILAQLAGLLFLYMGYQVYRKVTRKLAAYRRLKARHHKHMCLLVSAGTLRSSTCGMRYTATHGQMDRIFPSQELS